MKKTINLISVKTLRFLCILFFLFQTSIFSQDDVDIDDLKNMSFEDLMDITVISASLKEEKATDAPSNITVITRQMIDERGYQTLVEICEDLPGFDFMTYNDGGGEYPTFNMNRGAGTIGNAKILVMVDGIIQNNISFNWSLLWTYENLLIDIDRIEIIEGPGSAIYGAQAYTGVINFITRSEFSGVEASTFYGSNSSYGVDIYAGKKINDDLNISLALHKYNSDGDSGDRYDPGSYYHNLKYPETIIKDYDAEGNYLTDITNPIGGKNMPDGFQNWVDSYSLRAKVNYKTTELSAFLWENETGSASTYAPYEYNLTHEDSRTRSMGYHISLKNDLVISDDLSLQSNVVYRATDILPKTGFRYHWRFPNMTKNYVSYSNQFYLEERLSFNLSTTNKFLFGFKGTYSNKSSRIVSLDFFPESYTTTESSWDIANNGDGIYVSQTYPRYKVTEVAIYALWDSDWSEKLFTSIGMRYDYSTEFGNIINPRIAIIYKFTEYFSAKLLNGSAFRQPSIFELNSEFRGNTNLEPEKINTTELEVNSLLFNKKLNLRTNIFYSQMVDFIGQVPDSTKPSGARYENVGESSVAGLSIFANYQIHDDVQFYSNYMLMVGKDESSSSWEQIERTAKHKINAGINFHLLRNKLIIDLRMNFVGERKAQSTNKWLQKYEDGFAPSYTKFNLAITYKFIKHLSVRLTVKNLFNEQYYGIGRETGSGMIDEYDYQTNPNPDGFIPSYHPQPGRTMLLNLKYTL